VPQILIEPLTEDEIRRLLTAIPQDTLEGVRNFAIEHARPQPTRANEQHMFLNMAGDPISKDAVEKLMQRLSRRAGILRLHPHLLRHSFAVRYLMNGGDVFTLQKILGHASLEMTRKYVALASGDVKEKHRQYSPVDNLGVVEKKRGRPRRRRLQ